MGSSLVYEFRKAIEQEEQIYREYKNPDQLKLYLNQNLDEDLPEILKEALLQNIYEPETKPLTETIPDYILDNLDEADRMLSKDLMNEALEIYKEALKKINKRSAPEIFAKIKLQIAVCFINKSNYENEEKNLVLANIALEEAESAFDIMEKTTLCIKIYLESSKTYLCLSNIRDKNKNLEKAFEMGKNALDLSNELGCTEFVPNSCYSISTVCITQFFQNKDKQYFDLAKHYIHVGLTCVRPSSHDEIEAQLLWLYGQLQIDSSCAQTNPDDMEKSIQEGIDYAKQALSIVSLETNSLLTAEIKITLGIGYHYMGDLTRNIEYFHLAEKEFRASLLILSVNKVSSNYYGLQVNMCNLLQQEYRLTNDLSFIHESEKIIDEALQFVTLHNNPTVFSLLMTTRGYNLNKLSTDPNISKENKIALLKKSIQCYEQASLYHSPKDTYNYAVDTSWISKGHFMLSDYEEPAFHLKKALEYILESMIFYEARKIKNNDYTIRIEFKKKIEDKLEELHLHKE